MRWFRGFKDAHEPIDEMETWRELGRQHKMDELRPICNAFAYLQNQITAIENHVGMVTNEPQPTLRIKDAQSVWATPDDDEIEHVR